MATASTERWLQLASECALDLAHPVIADQGWKTPNTYREAFQVLRDEGALSPHLAHQMEQWAGLRNVLVHLYLEVDHERLYEVLQRDLDELERFAAEIRLVADQPRRPDGYSGLQNPNTEALSVHRSGCVFAVPQ